MLARESAAESPSTYGEYFGEYLPSGSEPAESSITSSSATQLMQARGAASSEALPSCSARRSIPKLLACSAATRSFIAAIEFVVEAGEAAAVEAEEAAIAVVPIEDRLAIALVRWAAASENIPPIYAKWAPSRARRATCARCLGPLRLIRLARRLSDGGRPRQAMLQVKRSERHMQAILAKERPRKPGVW
jgi:hypothetical protein